MPRKYLVHSITLIVFVTALAFLSGCGDATTPTIAGVDNTGMDEPTDAPPGDTGDNATPPDADCNECRGEATTLVLEYLGTVSDAHIVVLQKCPDVIIFDSTVAPGERFFLEGADANKTMGQELRVWVNDVLNATFHVSCSQEIGPGMIRGDFLIIEGTSKAGGTLCPYSGS